MLKKSYSMMDKNGILYGIGVGPGEPELMTLKALRIIRSCDVIVLPAASKEACYAYKIAYEVCPEIEEKILLCMPFPMIQDEEELELAHEKNYHEIEDYLCEGKNVGMLTIGDPSVYSTYLYMHHRAVEADFQAVMISGVPSFCASACRLGISLGEKNEEIHIIPASYSIEEALKYSGTCIYMKSGRHLKELLAGLREQQEKGRRLRAYGVANCGMENEQVYQGLDELERAEGYLVTVIVKMEYCLPRRFRAGVKKEWKKI
jgi:precorrin-2 C(20)-methyltransferase